MKMSKMMVGWMGVAAAVLVSGCTTPGYQKAESSANSMNRTKAELQVAQGQITTALRSMDKVTGAQVGDMRPLYQDFCAQVKVMQSAALSARDRVASMQMKNREYFAAWAQQIESIKDPSIKAQSLTRHEATKASYGKVEQMLLKTREAYQPLLASLGDIQTAMSQDLTPAGIAGLKPSCDKARQQTVALQSVIQETMAAIDQASGAMTPVASGAQQ